MAFIILDGVEDTEQTIAASDEVYQYVASLLAVDGIALTTGSGVNSFLSGETVGSNVGISLGGANELTLNASGVIVGLTGNAITLDAASSYVTLGGTVSGSDDGLFSNFGLHSVFNSGTITADNTTIDFRLGGNTVTNTGNLVSTSNDAVFINSGTDIYKNIFLNTGVITGAVDGVEINGVDSIFTNDGSILARADAVEMDGANAHITNNGSLSASLDGMQLANADFSVIQNNGTISAGAFGVEILMGVNVQVSNAGIVSAGTFGFNLREIDGSVIQNTGTINAGFNGIIADGGNILINNSGHISSSSGTGIFIKSDGGRVVNSGTVESRRGIAIDIENDLNLEGTSILNTGLIIGDDSDGGFAIQMDLTFGDVLRNSGTIEGGADLGGGDDLMVNSGEVFGSVTLGDGLDVYRGKVDGYVSELVDGGAGDDIMVGASQDDVFFGGDDNDNLRGAAGDDALIGEDGEDVIFGGTGNDGIIGGAQKDELFGGAGDDVVLGGLGQDYVYGGDGDDNVNGGGGNDVVEGGRGDDNLIGAGGSDVFVFGRKAGYDVISDFTNGTDKIDLTAFELINLNHLQNTFDVTQVNNGVQIDMGNGDAILIKGFAIGELTDPDFIF